MVSAMIPARSLNAIRSTLAGWRPRSGEWFVLLGYGVVFWALHSLAILWSGDGYYSLWFPAAGVRLALFWRFGARLTVAATATEIIVQLLTGVIAFDDPEWPYAMARVANPVVAYGVAVALVRAISRRSEGSLATAPMPLGLASVAAPLTAVIVALPWAIFRPDFTNVTNVRDVIASLTAFAVGDMLGVLLVAPPLLYAADLAKGHARVPRKFPRHAHVLEAMFVLGVSLALVATLATIGLGLPATPVLLAIAWIGLRFGRAAAWASIVVTALFVLPETTGAMALDQRLALHMSLAAVAVVGYLAGSFADAETRALAAVARRDRMLFQAERLKTLRAMSVAVIHEISQPLSTLSIETHHLAQISRNADPEIRETAALIERKTATLSTLVRRLRQFGGRAVDEPSILPIAVLLESVLALARPEATMAGVTIRVAPVDPDLAVMAQEVELAQAVVNLVRNAVQACDDKLVEIVVTREEDSVSIAVTNRCTDQPSAYDGMGVGSLVAKAIVDAHGGRLARMPTGAGHIAYVVTLPLAAEQV
jgi:signal transduction histidine kinase